MKKILIGSRKSPLALIQTGIIINNILQKFPGLEFEIIKFDTSGDINQNKNFNSGLKGVFTHEIEQALLNHKIDFAVHSLKDMAVNSEAGLKIIAYSDRADPRDVLILGDEKFKNMPVGTSSIRRKLQIKNLYPDLKIMPIRGNINTRIKKLDSGEFSGLILSAAGVCRMNFEDRIKKYFSLDEIIPAPGQGVLACQGRTDENYFYLDAINNKNSELCATAEREFSRTFGTGCNIPVGAYAEINNNILSLTGFYNSMSAKISGDKNNAKIIGRNLAETILNFKINSR